MAATGWRCVCATTRSARGAGWRSKTSCTTRSPRFATAGSFGLSTSPTGLRPSRPLQLAEADPLDAQLVEQLTGLGGAEDVELDFPAVRVAGDAAKLVVDVSGMGDELDDSLGADLAEGGAEPLPQCVERWRGNRPAGFA